MCSQGEATERRMRGESQRAEPLTGLLSFSSLFCSAKGHMKDRVYSTWVGIGGRAFKERRLRGSGEKRGGSGRRFALDTFSVGRLGLLQPIASSRQNQPWRRRPNAAVAAGQSAVAGALSAVGRVAGPPGGHCRPEPPRRRPKTHHPPLARLSCWKAFQEEQACGGRWALVRA